MAFTNRRASIIISRTDDRLIAEIRLSLKLVTGSVTLNIKKAQKSTDDWWPAIVKLESEWHAGSLALSKQTASAISTRLSNYSYTGLSALTAITRDSFELTPITFHVSVKFLPPTEHVRFVEFLAAPALGVDRAVRVDRLLCRAIAR